MFNRTLLLEAMVKANLNMRRLGKLAEVDAKTAKNVVMYGRGRPESIYAVAHALGFKVKMNDISAIVTTGFAEEAPNDRRKRTA